MIPAFDLALSELKKVNDPLSKICSSSAYWIPLQWVYSEMVRNKDLVSLSELGKEEKGRYWDMVKNLEKDKWAKIMIAQSLYVYENLKQ